MFSDLLKWLPIVVLKTLYEKVTRRCYAVNDIFWINMDIKCQNARIRNMIRDINHIRTSDAWYIASLVLLLKSCLKVITFFTFWINAYNELTEFQNVIRDYNHVRTSGVWYIAKIVVWSNCMVKLSALTWIRSELICTSNARIPQYSSRCKMYEDIRWNVTMLVSLLNYMLILVTLSWMILLTSGAQMCHI